VQSEIDLPKENVLRGREKCDLTLWKGRVENAGRQNKRKCFLVERTEEKRDRRSSANCETKTRALAKSLI